MSVPVPVAVVPSGLTRVNWPFTSAMSSPVVPSPSVPAERFQYPYCGRMVPVPIRLPKASDGPSSSKRTRSPTFCSAVSTSRSPSVTVSTALTRVAVRLTASSWELGKVGCFSARYWAVLRKPLLSMEMAKATGPVSAALSVAPTRPTTRPPSS
ncbi:hypothetical protein D3C85_1098550 [compost metagenome]